MPTNTNPSLNLVEFERLTGQRGWVTNDDIATGLHLDPATISRVRRGLQRAGAKFMSACLDEFGALAYDRLFRDEERAA